MKHTLIFLMAAILFLSGCGIQGEPEEPQGILWLGGIEGGVPVSQSLNGVQQGITHLGGSSAIINLSPRTPEIRNGVEQTWYEVSVVEFGKDGGEAKVKAFFPPEEKVKLNDYYTTYWVDTWGKDRFTPPSNLYSVTRKEISDYSTEYTLRAGENTTGREIQYVIAIWDNSRVDAKGGHITSRASIIIKQPAE